MTKFQQIDKLLMAIQTRTDIIKHLQGLNTLDRIKIEQMEGEKCEVKAE